MKSNLDKIHNKTTELKDLIFDPTVRILPGNVAFFLILSLFPLLMLVGYVASLCGLSINFVVDIIHNTIPDEMAHTIIEVISGKSFDSTIGISMIVGFILASNGTHAIILASNALYGFPADDFVRRRVKAMFMIILLVVLFVFIILFLAYGNVITKIAIEVFHLKWFESSLYTVFSIIKWPVAMFLMFWTIKLIYVIAPDWKILSKNTTKGALFTTLGWTISTFVFSYYVTHFANYDIFYGSLSSIVVLMIWVYVLSYILILGIAINVKKYRDEEEELG